MRAMILVAVVTVPAASVRAEQVARNMNPATGQCADDPDDEAPFLQIHKGPAGTPAASLNPTAKVVAAQYKNTTRGCTCPTEVSECSKYLYNMAGCYGTSKDGVPVCKSKCTCASVPYSGCASVRGCYQYWQPAPYTWQGECRGDKDFDPIRRKTHGRWTHPPQTGQYN
eukprot:gnl/TRDRNA2_/TRDRNA2_174928_c0_seq1.p1 gnl/TRDRNA2_/TRDRNA2_174928_c0~~gnl/TRDRNA2_/TRDRNA2_174928_c0_seq1.p1  ORF type:complete len:169 (+),score=6.06 gnl/TRDRNA2_/TRDRNA2_174928_c0_seq1:105-611(+)